MKGKDMLSEKEKIKNYIKKNIEVNISDLLAEFLIPFSELSPILTELCAGEVILKVTEFSYKYNFSNILGKDENSEETEVEKPISPIDDLLNSVLENYKKTEFCSIYIIEKSAEIDVNDPILWSKILLIADDPRQVLMELEQGKGYPIRVCYGLAESEVEWSIKQLKSLGFICCARLGYEFFPTNYNDENSFQNCCIKCMEEILMLGKDLTLKEAKNISTILFNISVCAKNEKAIKVYTKIANKFKTITTEEFNKTKKTFFEKKE